MTGCETSRQWNASEVSKRSRKHWPQGCWRKRKEEIENQNLNSNFTERLKLILFERVGELFQIRVWTRANSVTSGMASLLHTLQNSLASFPGAHTYTIQILRSQPRRSHALFPHATNLKTKVWQEEVLVLLSEDTDVSVILEGVETVSKASIPVFAIEASLYEIPSTSTTLLYISKVDTTGLSTTYPSPARTLTASFLAYHLLHPPHQSKRIRIHVFAKAQGQYLFPGSVDNKGKKVLDDKGLIRWWKGCISQAVTSKSVLALSNVPKLFYLIPGLSHTEALPYAPDDSSSAAKWIYNHPYSTIPSPLFVGDSTEKHWTVNDLVPAFPDDPKSRFLTSLTSSGVSATGEADDYDDVMNSLASATFLGQNGRKEGVERERERERRRLTCLEGGIEEFWERMAFRQECCSGVLVGFFVVAFENLSAPTKIDSEHHPTSVPHAVFTSLWSQLHNVDYSTLALEKLSEIRTKWSEDFKSLIACDGFVPVVKEKEGEAVDNKETRMELLYSEFAFTTFVVENSKYESKKREAVEVKVVNKMVPRKKKKVE